MIIFGYSLDEKYIYYAGGAGLLLRLGNKLFSSNSNETNRNLDKEKEEEKRKEKEYLDKKQKEEILTEELPYVILFKREAIKTYTCILLDEVKVVEGRDSNTIKLLYTENSTSFLIFGRMRYHSGGYWKFYIEDVKSVKNNKATEIVNDDKESILMKRISSIRYFPNVNFKKSKNGKNFILGGALGIALGADMDGDGNKGELEDGLITGFLASLLLDNKNNKEIKGLYLKINTPIEIQP